MNVVTIARLTIKEAVSRRLILAGVLLSLAFLALFGAGFLLCTVGLSLAGGQRGFSWLHPLTMLAAVTGTAALILGALVLFNRPLPCGLSMRQASLLMTGIIFAKWALTYLHQIILK